MSKEDSDQTTCMHRVFSACTGIKEQILFLTSSHTFIREVKNKNENEEFVLLKMNLFTLLMTGTAAILASVF